MSVQRLPFLDVFIDASGGNIKTPQSEFLDEGEIPVVDQGQQLIAGYVNDVDRVCKAKPPVIVFGDHTRAVKFVDFEFAMGADGTKVLVPKVESDLKYLFYALSALNIPNAGYSRHYKFLKEMEIPLPPLPEQKRIARILDAADALRARRRTALAELDALLQSTFLDMFGDPVTNPMGWEVVKSAELYLDKPRIGTPKPANGNGYLVVRVGEVGDTQIRFANCSRIELTNTELNRYAISEGDTIIARAIGSKDQLGKASFFDGHVERVVIDSHVMRLRPNPAVCDPQWFYCLVSSQRGKTLLQSKGGATAVQFNINAKQASDLDIPLPPIDLQHRFSTVFSSIEKQKQRMRAHLSELDALFASLQSRAFNGEL